MAPEGGFGIGAETEGDLGILFLAGFVCGKKRGRNS